MQDELNTTIREAIDRLYPSLDDVAPDWGRVVTDASPRRRSAPARPQRLRRSRRHLVRGALVAAAAAAVALGALSVLPGDGPSAIARAANALRPAADRTILHTVVVTTQIRSGGTTTVSRTETWLQTSPPYAARELGGRELAQVDGALQYYDPRTNAIHTTPPNAVPATQFTLDADSLRDRMLTLLRSGQAREEGHVTVDGRDAIRIVSSDGNMTLIVDAATHDPIEWSWVSDEGVSETSRFDTYEWLPATKHNLALLSLTAQHPNATIRQDATVTGTNGEGK
jgi:hypothetical protein